MKVVLIGAANPETIRMISNAKKTYPNLEILGFLDNDSSKWDKAFYGYPILGPTSKAATLLSPDVHFVNLITGSTAARLETSREMVRQGFAMTNLIHSSVDLTMTVIGEGNYIQENVVLQAEVKIGENSSIHMGALIGHESQIGNTVFIAHGCSISGICTIGDGTFIGTNATVLPRVRIGKWAIIGAGSVVTRDVPSYAVVVGNPGRIIKENRCEYDNGRTTE